MLPERMGISFQVKGLLPLGRSDYETKVQQTETQTELKPDLTRNKSRLSSRRKTDTHVCTCAHSVTPCKEPKDPYAEERSRQGLCLADMCPSGRDCPVSSAQLLGDGTAERMKEEKIR